MNKIEFYSNLAKFQGRNGDAFLKHYGIIGQKWGQRRWQNADGTFNEEGKERYFGSKGNKEEKVDEKADKSSKNKWSMNDLFKKAGYNYDNSDDETRELFEMEVNDIRDSYKNGNDINKLSKEFGYDKNFIQDVINSDPDQKVGSTSKKENKVDYDDILEKVYNNRFDNYSDLSKQDKNKLIKEIDKIRKDYENGKSLSDIQEDSEFDERKVLYAIDDLRRKNDNIIENPDEKTIKERNENNERQIQEFLKEKEDIYNEWGKSYYEEQFKDDPKSLQKAIDGDEVIRKMTEDTIRDNQELYDKHLNEYINKYGYDPEDIQDIKQTARAEYNIYKGNRGPLFYDNTKNKKFIDITKDEWNKLSESEKQSYEFAKHYEINDDWQCDNVHGSLKYSMKDKNNNIKWKVEYYPIEDGSFNDRTKDSTQVYQNMDKYIKDFQKDFKSNLSKIEQNLKNSNYIPQNAKLKLEYINLASLRNTENEGFFPELEFDINNGEDSIGISIDPKTLKIEDVG